MTAYMSINTAVLLEGSASCVRQSATPVDGVTIHELIDFKDGLIIYSDGSQITVDMKSFGPTEKAPERASCDAG